MRWFVLIAIFFVTSIVSVVTGSTSIVTVPVLLQFGMDAKRAIATNMFALTFLSLGGTVPFISGGVFDRRRLPLLIGLTLIGSAIGALTLLVIPAGSLRLMVSLAVIGVAIFSTAYRRAGMDSVALPPGPRLEAAGYVLTFLMGIYGGMFSGGYVTVLTAIFVATFRMSFTEAVATTKLVNIFSSGIATFVFMLNGAVAWRLGCVLSIAMFLGALLGAHVARRVGNEWLRRIYLAAVWLLGIKTLIDVIRAGPHDRPLPEAR